MFKKIYFTVFALALVSCNPQKEVEANTDLLYFDIKGYFSQEAARLQLINPEIKKQVSANGVAESKATRISSWQKEFSIFTDADINKSSWKGSFKAIKTNQNELYTSVDKKISVKKVLVEKQGNKVTKVEIYISRENILYHSSDTLRYYPDSLYRISKQQNIKLLAPKKYLITGRFK